MVPIEAPLTRAQLKPEEIKSDLKNEIPGLLLRIQYLLFESQLTYWDSNKKEHSSRVRRMTSSKKEI